MNLIDLTNDYLKVKEMAENGEIPFEAVADTLDGLEGEFDSKADGIASLVKRLTAEAGAIKSEEDNLYKRRKAKENAAERLKSYLLGQMTQIGKKKLETASNVISVSLSPPSVRIEDEKALYAIRPDLFVAAEPKADKNTIKTLLKGGEEIPGVFLEQKERLGIR